MLKEAEKKSIGNWRLREHSGQYEDKRQEPNPGCPPNSQLFAVTCAVQCFEEEISTFESPVHEDFLMKIWPYNLVSKSI